MRGEKKEDRSQKPEFRSRGQGSGVRGRKIKGRGQELNKLIAHSCKQMINRLLEFLNLTV